MKNKFKVLIYIVFFICAKNTCWAQEPPKIVATGEQSYCPTTQINVVTSFGIIDKNNTEIDAFYIQISSGYTSGEDRLILNGTHPNIEPSWSGSEGKLALKGLGGGPAIYTDLIAAVKDVVFESTIDTAPGDKLFSFTIGNANYLPSTGHYYEFVSDPGIKWPAARIAAAARNYYGLKGYLVTILAADEAKLAGEQAPGVGWIGGSDVDEEGVWKWVTGPGTEADVIFWNGDYKGSTPNYANWNFEEPNNSKGKEHYAHISDPAQGSPGTWNDLKDNGGSKGSVYYPKGYIVEYGGSPGDPDLDISASTKINIPTIVNTETPAVICGSGSTTLKATTSSGDVVWFGVSTGGTSLFTGAEYITPTISATTSYYVDTECLNGTRTEVTVTVNPLPTITSVNDTTICDSGSATLSAVASAGTISWYSASVGGTAIATGLSYTTPILSSTTTYYVDATNSDCKASTRTPVTVVVEKASVPTGNGVQAFCDIENATIASLVVNSTDVLWYRVNTGGIPLDTSELLISNTDYYVSQATSSCGTASASRFKVTVLIHKTVKPLASNDIVVFEICDSMDDADDTNGIAQFNLRDAEPTLLNGSNAADFEFSYFTDAAQSISIANAPEVFENTIPNEQTIYVRIENVSSATCFTNRSLKIKVQELPVIQPSIVFKNCDEDGVSDGFTDFNLNEINDIITNGNSNGLKITYHTSMAEANLGTPIIKPVPYNNQTSSLIYARVENENTGCYRLSTINLEVSTTSFSAGFIHELDTCDNDANIDGFHEFNLTSAFTSFIDEFPSGQNLSVHYYKNLQDAQLEVNEILNTINYVNETAFTEILYVRVENDDNGGCFGIGPHLLLTVHPRPEFEVDQKESFCLGDGPVTLNTFNPKGLYTYNWQDADGNDIVGDSSVVINAEGTYTVIAISNKGCESFPVSFDVKASGVSGIDANDVAIVGLSENNTITINDADIGIGDYEYALDNEFGSFQDDPFFSWVFAGKHTLYVRDKSGCGTASLPLLVMGFPKYFTPNGDGNSDTWNVKGLSNEYIQSTTVFIYDRYGKLIKELNPRNEGWNGTFNGQNSINSDYWFVINLVDNKGVTRIYKGHFSLLR